MRLLNLGMMLISLCAGIGSFMGARSAADFGNLAGVLWNGFVFVLCVYATTEFLGEL